MELEAYNDFSLENREGEVWKDIYDYEGSYQISNHGRVKSFIRKEFIKKQRLQQGKNYFDFRIKLRYASFIVHRLVALHFLDEPLPTQYSVEHIDGDYYNNYSTNLRWITNDDRGAKQSITPHYCMSEKMFNKKNVKYHGVSYHKSMSGKNKYVVVMKSKIHNINRQKYYFTPEEAARAYDDFIVKHNLKRNGNFIDNR